MVQAEQVGSMGNGSDIAPVFVMGCQRSGTTMLAAQLGRGSDAIAFPEMQFVHRLLHPGYRASHDAGAAWCDLQGDFRYRAAGLLIDRLAFEAAYNEPDPAAPVRALIAANLPPEKRGRPLHWIEHNPLNLNAVLELMAAFPAARFIHVVRDPRAVYYSMKSNPRWNMADPESFAAVWNQAVAKGFLYAARFPEQVIEVSYEAFVAAPEQGLQRLCRFLQIGFEPTMLEGGGVQLPAFTRQQHQFTLRPADATRAEVWRQRLPDIERRYIETHCFQWMENYGYAQLPRPLEKFGFGRRLLFMGNAARRKLSSKLVTLYQNRQQLAHSKR
jgi:hypothetical protein